jgi:hypothetical protein
MNAGVYILQNTMVVGGGMSAGEKILKLRVWGKNENEGKGEKEKGEKRLKKRCKNGLKTHL